MPQARSLTFVLAIALGACGPAVSSGSFSEMPVPPASGDVAVFSTKVPACLYDEIGLVHVQRRHGFTGLQSMVDAMRDRAREMGGHAIVGVAFAAAVNGVGTENGTAVSTDSANGLSGTVIRFKDDSCRQ